MKTIVHSARSRDKLLHIETDGCVVNIQIGLTDAFGRRTTRIDVLPDGPDRGGDGEGRTWHRPDPWRVVRDLKCRTCGDSDADGRITERPCPDSADGKHDFD